MSDKGWWGDKLIFVLTSDGEKRHKKWCVFFDNDDKLCLKRGARCPGSAFCNEYEKREGVGVVEKEKFKYIPHDVIKTCAFPLSSEIVDAPITKELIGVRVRPDVPKYISDIVACHPIKQGEKLVGNVVIINLLYKVLFGEVKSFDLERLVIECDNGEIKSFITKEAVRQKHIFAVDEIPAKP